MLNRFESIAITVALLVLANTSFALAETKATPVPNLVAQATPSPSPTKKPGLTWRVPIRAYDFTRQNASNTGQNAANKAINQWGFNLGILPHVEYDNIWKGLLAGVTYVYANPLNGCATPEQHLSPPCKAVVPHGQLPNGGTFNYDDTVPAFQLNTLMEAFVGWKDQKVYAKVGNQVINTPWAPASDTRIKPNAFQGIDASYTFNSNWLIEGTDMVRYENRTASDFSRSTLITSFAAGAAGIGSNIYNPGGQTIETSGYPMARLGYTKGPVAANFWYYGFLQIANAYWLDAKYTFSEVPFHPFVAVQFGDENNTGSAVVGKIDSQIYGVQGGINLPYGILITAAYDDIPIRTDTITLPHGYKCGGANTISVGKVTESLPYFLPSGGTANCSKNTNGTTNIYYGGWASPYSDSYATDPIFTTSLTQGMADRRSPGQSYLARITFSELNHQLVIYGSYAGYDYNNPGGAQATHEGDADLLFYLNKAPTANQLYRGFLFHYRYGERTQSGSELPTPNGYGGSPLFKYNRFQFEYDI